MTVLPIIIVAEIITATLFLNFSFDRPLIKTANQASDVLGVAKIAQVYDPVPNEPTEEPSPTAAPQENQPTPLQETVKEPILLPTALATDEQNLFRESNATPNTNAPQSEKPSLLDQILNPPTPSVSEQNNGNAPIPLPSEEQSLQVLQTMSLLNPADLISSPENINHESIEEAQKEEKKLAEAQTPAEQTELLIHFAKDKVRDIDTFLRIDDFASTNFAVQRLSLDIDKALETIQTMPLFQQFSLKKQLTSFCKQADEILRSAELLVPEESEQDIEMSRGACLNSQL